MWLKRTIKYFFYLFLIAVALIALFIGSVYIGVFGPLPDDNELVGINNEEASLVYSSDGTLIGKYFAENRTNIKWDEVPENLVNALVATEDKRFFEHEGIDGRSYLRVLVKSILMGDRSSGGGSTLTQQLVKNLYGRDDHSFLSMPVSKVREAIIASRMESVLTKEDILLLYLNSVPFGEEVFGIEAASKRYFDKNAKDLYIEESAVLVGILKANTYYNPRLHPDNATRRRNQVITLMANEDFISEKDSERLKAMPLGLKYTNYQLASQAGYFVYQVKKRAIDILEGLRDENGIPYDIRKDGLKIHTTLDIKLQKLANQAAEVQLASMQPRLDRELIRFGQRKKWENELAKKRNLPPNWNDISKREILTADGMQTADISLADSVWHYYKMLNAAVLATNPKSGAVLAWTGGNDFRYLPYDMVLAEHQIASTIKPFIYAAALEEEFETCDYFSNSIKEYKDYKGWKPENYDKSSSDKMKVAMWYALSRSLNLPTVDLYFETGHDEVADLLRRLDLDAPYEETPAIALGALDASLYELVKAYGAFANKGELPEDLMFIEKITDADGYVIYTNQMPEQFVAMDQEVADQITTMLEIAIDEGTGRKMRSGYGMRADLAGKTGTAQNYSDAWFVAYTPDIVIGTWVGARSPQMHFRSSLGSGSALALPITGRLMASVQADPTLSHQYLSPFDIQLDSADIIDCEPFREKGLSGVFNRMKKQEDQQEEKEEKNKKAEKKEEVEKEPEKEKSKVGKFFDNLFKKKDKKEKKKKR